METRKHKITKTAAITLMLLIVVSMIAAPVSAFAFDRPDIDYDWNNPCCDGGDCCIKNDCSCPMCYGRGEPGTECPDCGADLCPDCGNCPDCGTSPCPSCRTGEDPTVCPDCGSDLCNACWGCPECGNGQDSDCPYCNKTSPLFRVGNTDIYLFAPADMPSWSIFSLIAVIGSLAVLGVAVTRAAIQKKSEDEEEMHSFKLQAVDAVDNDSLIETIESKERLNTRRRLWALAATFIITIANIVIFIATQDFRGITALFDYWSIVHGVLLAGAAVLSIITFRRYENE